MNPIRVLQELYKTRGSIQANCFPIIECPQRMISVNGWVTKKSGMKIEIGPILHIVCRKKQEKEQGIKVNLEG